MSEGCMGSGPGVPGPGNGIVAPILATTKKESERVEGNKIIVCRRGVLFQSTLSDSFSADL